MELTSSEDSLFLVQKHGSQVIRKEYKPVLQAQQEDLMPASHGHGQRHLNGGISGYGSVSPDTEMSVSSDWDPQRGRMSAARRTFCLFTTFDLILSFILWVIYTQLIGIVPIWRAFKDQVFNYTFQMSLFDTVMIATARFTFIMLAYALFRISHWWVIAVSTSMTCIYLLVKCFLFEFNNSVLGGKNPLSYVVLIVCFVLAWLETWMLDFKVIPTERRLTHQARGTERERLLRADNSNDSDEARTVEYYSPFHTPEGSDDEAEHQGFQSLHSSNTHSRKASDASLYSVRSTPDLENYGKLLEEAREKFLELLHMDGWKAEGGNSLETGIITSQSIKKYGRKIFKLVGVIDMPPKDLWQDMIATLNDSPKWNPTILESRTLQVLDDSSEITYNIAAEGGGGLVSARDFVSVRQWLYHGNGQYLSISIGCTHNDMPAQKKYVRGDNGPGGWAFDPAPNDPSKCLFTWIVNTNLKGWLPQAAIDQAMSGVMSTYFKLLKEHYREVKDSVAINNHCA